MTPKDTHTCARALGRTRLDEGSARRTVHDNTQHSTETCPWQGSNPQTQQASDHRPQPYTVPPAGWDNYESKPSL